MTLTKTVEYSFLTSDKEILQRILWANKILRDRKDFYLLDLCSLREDRDKMEISFDYECLEVNINPDNDW